MAANCPSRKTLLEYSIGLLPDEQSDELAGHLDSCPDCQAAILTLDDAEDTLIGQLRAAPGSQSCVAEPEFQAALADAIALPRAGTGPFFGENAVLAYQGLAENMDLSPSGRSTGLLQMLGEYQILGQLGRGGMGRVYKALHTKLDRVVALKVLPRARLGDQKAIARFEREMKAVGRLAHPNIVQAHDAREIDDMPVLIMEFVDGLDLAEISRRVGRLPLAEACELMRQTAVALQCAHEHGLVHRDIKPSNIMLARSGDVKLLDLGLARFYAEDGRVAVDAGPLSLWERDRVRANDANQPAPLAASPKALTPSPSPKGRGDVIDDMTGTGQAMGTADYMAPEQASDSRTVDIRADLYSLGCTLYKLLSGRAPFSGPEYRNTLEKLNAHVHQPAPPIRHLVPEVPEKLAAILDRLLAKDPADRYATPAEVAEVLVPWCAGADLPALLQRAVEAKSSPLPPGEGSRRSPLPLGEGQGEGRPLAASQRWKSRIVIAVALLLVGGLGFALGILIRINGTTIDVPEGSKVRVAASGQIDVTSPGKAKSAEPVQQPEESPLQFAPVMERVVNALGEGKGGEGLDLASGKVVDMPKEFGKWPAQQREKWCEEKTVDLVAELATFSRIDPTGQKSLALVPEGLKLAALWDGHWHKASRENLQTALASANPAVAVAPEVAETPGGNNSHAIVLEAAGVTYFVPVDGDGPLTFAFQTRKGELGILQVIRYTEEPRGMRIRYKMAKPPAIPAASKIESPKNFANSKVKMFFITNGDAESLMNVVQKLIPTGDTLKPVRLSVDARTNSIIAIGDPESMSIVEAILLRLDEKGRRDFKPNTSTRSSNSSTAIRTAAVSPAAELKALQGQWKVAHAEIGRAADVSWHGRWGTVNPEKIEGIDFEDGFMSTLEMTEGRSEPFLFSINPKTEPKTIDVRSQTDNILAAGGIYEFKDNRLRVCLAGIPPGLESATVRPHDFAIDAESGDILLVLERYCPSKEEKAIEGDWTVIVRREDGKDVSGFWSCRFRHRGFFIDQTGPMRDSRVQEMAMSGLFSITEPNTISLYTRDYYRQENPGQLKENLTGIYKLADERLTIAWRKNGPPPEKFESKPGSGITLLVLERKKPSGSAEVPGPKAAGATPLLLKISGPDRRVVGEKAQFAIEVTNTGTTPLKNLTVVDRYDSSLKPIMASDGYRDEKGSLAWTIAALPPGKTTPLVVHFNCRKAAPKAGMQVIVTTSSGFQETLEAHLEITNLPAVAH